MQQNSFIVYNASAGSGKTYTLVKRYLETLFLSNNKDKFKNILAITFTNKAVSEMKDRILSNLKAYSDDRILTNSEMFENEYQMFTAISENLSISKLKLHQKAKIIQQAILNNYAAFDVVTIDTFTHRIIRTFAYDLKLSQNFEVVLDTHDVLQEAVNNLVEKVGENNALTQLLIDFAMQKTDDDKSWDISLDLYKISKILLNEGEIKHINLLKDKTLADFSVLNKRILKKIEVTAQKIIEIAKKRITVFEENEITENHINSVYNYFLKYSKNDFSSKYDLVWQMKLLENQTIYPKRVSKDIGAVIDAMQVKIVLDFIHIKKLYYTISFLKNRYKNSVPLSAINSVQKELEELKKEQNILLISEFNSIVFNEIKNQPAPFIYERIGERYQNYFIDEFQDTSELQWKNLIPLVENALVSETKDKNSLLLVGDAKQAIYRWRGGKAEQFINLYENKIKSPFYIEKQIENLDVNWRSYSEIIDFNNKFFTHISNIFANKTHQNLYEIGNKQKENHKKGGLVEVSFVEKGKVEDTTVFYQEKVGEIIQKVLQNGFQLADICVLTRSRKNGIAIADYLTSKQIKIVSSETLLINKSESVQFITSLLAYLINPHYKTKKIEVLFFLHKKMNVNSLKIKENQFYIDFLKLSQKDFFKKLATEYHLQFDYTLAETLPFYELVEYIIRAFNLINYSDAHVQYFLDEVLSFSQKKTTGIVGFLEYWETKKEKLSIVAPQGNNAVTLMTIHKSKGLEFPVVIFPFADDDIYYQIEPKTWYPINKQENESFQEAYLSYNKDLEKYGEIGAELYHEKQSELELDNMNLLYVALTRAKEQLYIVTKLEFDAKGNEKMNKFSGFLINYLKSIHEWIEDAEADKHTYTFGNPEKQSTATKILDTESIPFISTSRINHNLSIITKSGYIWDTKQQKAIEKGNLIHLILSKIKHQRDLEFVYQDLKENGTLNDAQINELKPVIDKLVLESKVSKYFKEEYTIYNEQIILNATGKINIPDRIAIKNNQAIIIDYKTGEKKEKHHQQLKKYEALLLEIGITTQKKILVYLDNQITTEEVA